MQGGKSGKCWLEQLSASIRLLVMNSQLTINLFQEWPVNKGEGDGCWGGKKGIYYLAANYLATAISIHEIAVWLKGLVNQIDNGLELGGWKAKWEGNKMSQRRGGCLRLNFIFSKIFLTTKAMLFNSLLQGYSTSVANGPNRKVHGDSRVTQNIDR